MVFNLIGRLPLRYKLNGIVLLVTATILSLVSVAFYVHRQQTLERWYSVELSILGKIYSQSCTAALAFGDKNGARKLLQSISAKKNILAAAVFDADGKLFVSYAPTDKGRDLLGEYVGAGRRRLAGGNIFSLVTPMVLDGETLGKLLLVADFSAVYAPQKEFVAFLMLLFCVALLGSIMLSSRLQCHIMRPIDNLMSTMEVVSRDNDFSARVESTTGGEFGHLCRQFNAMLHRIEQQDKMLKTQKEGLRFLATHDALTKLPNRNLYHDRLRKAIARARRSRTRGSNTGLAVLFIDLDRFKNINDTLGHDAGDELLVTIAERLKGSIREVDTVARFGGDEFVMLIDNIDPEDLNFVVGKVQKAVRQPVDLGGHSVVVTFSMGISVFPQHGETPEQLVKFADVAMYHAKNSGRDSCHSYHSDMALKVQQRFDIETRLQLALEEEELFLHFQPQYSLSSGEMCGCEALLRWCTDGQMIAPTEFIPVAEECGLIVPIGAWVIDAACRQAAHWYHGGYGRVPVAVNVSARQFFSSTLLDDISKSMKKHDLPAELFEVEITESMVMDNVDEAIGIMRNLSDMGVGIALDDFGTGYSSLAYLKRFPLNKIKIDRSFVRDILVDRDDASITRAVISMSLAMNFNVIAEGIETKEQFEFLNSLGCQQGQGYLMSRPVPADEFVTLLMQPANAGTFSA